MKKILLAIGLLGVVWFGVEAISTQRELSLAYQDVEVKISQVQNVLSRQAQLIPNLAATAKSYAKFESDTFAKVAAFRSVGSATPDKIANSADLQKNLSEQQAAVTQAFLSFKAVQERYPELKANENFSRLMNQLEGSINRVTVERKKSMEAVRDYNKLIVQFPRNVIAGVIGYRALPFYQAAEAEQVAPDLTKVLN